MEFAAPGGLVSVERVGNFDTLRMEFGESERKGSR